MTDATVGTGNLNRSGNVITWTLTPSQAETEPTLTIVSNVSSDPCDAGQIIANVAGISGATTACRPEQRHQPRRTVSRFLR